MADDVWEEFRRARVRIHVAGGVLDVAPTAERAVGTWLAGATGPIHIVTAYNPMGRAAPGGANAAAHRRLTAELATSAGVVVWPATGYGGGPIGAADTWTEDGYAIQGLDRTAAVELAGRYGQRAIFAWSDEPGGFRLVACDGSVDEARGWTATFIPVPVSQPGDS